MKRFLALILISIIGSTAAARADDLPVLTVYTYSSFVSDWGPGPAVKKAFEADCACKLNFVAVEDGVVLLSRLRLEGASSPADVVLGIDTKSTVLLMLSLFITAIALRTGRTILLHGIVLLVIFVVYLFTTVVP